MTNGNERITAERSAKGTKNAKVLTALSFATAAYFIATGVKTPVDAAALASAIFGCAMGIKSIDILSEQTKTKLEREAAINNLKKARDEISATIEQQNKSLSKQPVITYSFR